MVITAEYFDYDIQTEKIKEVICVSDFIDIVTLQEERQKEKEKPKRKEKPVKKKKTYKSEPVIRGDKEFIRFEEDRDEIYDFINNLEFSDKIRILFGKKVMKGGQTMDKENIVNNKAASKLFRIIVSVLLVALMSIIVIKGMGEKEVLLPAEENQPVISTEQNISESSGEEWVKVKSNIEAELNLYEREELRRINDYLNNRGNRGATITALKTQRSKKENSYYYLVQNKTSFDDNMGSYETLEERLVESLAFSEKALGAFDGRTPVKTLKSMVN